MTVDSEDHIWSVNSAGTIREFEPYPSSSKIAEWTTPLPFGCAAETTHAFHAIAIGKTSSQLYLAGSRSTNSECEGLSLDVFDPGTGNFVEEWLPSTYDTNPPISGSFSPLSVAVDNSGGPSDGRIYIVAQSGLKAFFPHHIPSNFEGPSPYVENNQIVAAPDENAQTHEKPEKFQESYQELDAVTVDKHGNIYIAGGYQRLVWEYTYTGAYVRTFVLPGGFNPDGQLSGLAVDPISGDLAVVDTSKELVYEFIPNGELVEQFPDHMPKVGVGSGVGFDSHGYLYFPQDETGIAVYSPQPRIDYEPFSSPTPTGGTLNAKVSPEGGEITGCKFEWGTTTAYGQEAPCETEPPSSLPFAGPTDVHVALLGLTAETTYHYRVSIETSGGPGKPVKGIDQTYTPHRVVGLSTDPVTGVTGVSATLHGSFVGNGEDTHYFFEWGTTTAYGHKTAEPPGLDAGSPNNAPQRTALSYSLAELDPVTTYHYRVVARNGAGISYGDDQTFATKRFSPVVKRFSTDTHSESATINALIDPGGEATTYHFEWGEEDCSLPGSSCTSVPAAEPELGGGTTYQHVSSLISGLEPSSTYHYRVVATNPLGTTTSPDATFTTFPHVNLLKDPCPNALARQQTGGALLLDCRGYELVSAVNSGGYDVESDLVPGQEPYGGYPLASGASGVSRLLYGVHGGAIPGVPGNPTTRGLDPYVATREPAQERWTTSYVGIPADDPFASGPFSSVPTAASSSLEAFSFGGPGGCSPCFSGGYTGIPVRLPSGALVQGMATSPGFPEPPPSATPDGYVAKALSADGSHLIFGSTSQFAAGGNDSSGDTSIYDHDLNSGETHVVSNTPDGEDFPEPLACLQGVGHCHSPGDSNGIAELDVSADGSRVLLGQKVSTDADGNVYWHLYMNVGDSNKTIDLTPGVIASPGGPGSTEGVLFGGMTEDGSRVFFTTRAQLAGGNDSDTSADLYEAEVDGSGASIARLSSGAGAGNTDSCTPTLNSDEEHWNTDDGSKNCDVVAVGGGGGVAAAEGSVYFLSPEKLTDCGCAEPLRNPVQNQPNLYLATPGSPLAFVATLSPDDPLVRDSVEEGGVRHTADFQVTPDGRFAAFSTTQPLSAYVNAGFSEVYRYATASGGDEGSLECASCSPANAKAAGDATLASHGLSLSDDGRVFFNSADALILRDSDSRRDVYEWEQLGDGNCTSDSPSFNPAAGDCISLISSGSSPFDSSLLGVSADATDAFFFTHDSLARQDNENGPVTKIYDARVDGGFFALPMPPACAASDECHGPGSQEAAPPPIRTVESVPGNPVPCKPSWVERNGTCVKKRHHHHPRKHRRNRHKKARR